MKLSPSPNRPTLDQALCLGAQRILKMAAKELDEAGADPDFVDDLIQHASVLLRLACENEVPRAR